MPFGRPSLRRAAVATTGAALAAMLAVPGGVAVAAPTATRLPVPAGTTNADVSDINNAGVAVGAAEVDGVSRALRWPGTGFTALPGTAEYPSTFASRITDAGQIVGTATSADGTQRTVRRWLPDGTAADCALSGAFPLGVVDLNERGDALVSGLTGPRRFTALVCRPDGTSVLTGLWTASAIGDDGRVAGALSGTVQNNFNFVPAVVAADGTLTRLPVPAGQSGVAYDVGPLGAVVGALGSISLATGIPVFVPRVAVVWVGGRTVELGTLGGDTSRPADTGRAVSRTGDIVGTSTTAAGETHAFLWRAGRLTDLGTLGGPSSTPTAVNDRGQVVGFSTTRSGAQHAFLWSGGRMVDLGAPGGATSTARDVNNAGQVVGTVTTSGGQRHAVRWTGR
ncbi:HAF repeat-containing protein [Cryptosporangium aurantiacum]|uniref:Probable extracellular repeat, HAF family n=1 Tax=Cryptosporangium aurantiacum TaxID=134849 RepID=A0A1M7RK77_9ACTN|nr:HAF repeat-containing protein [Cryptosporangium aurantiacum]SHN46478.1 probable extracellular repeat, HAF family [Cryptosporangium aurantiacum]